MLRPAVRRMSTASRALRAEPKGALKLRFGTPKKILFDAEIQSVVLPAASGDMGILADHVPAVIQLRPGVIEVKQDPKPLARWFVPGGFAIMAPDNVASITAPDAILVEDLDIAKATAELAKVKVLADSASGNPEAKATAQIQVETYEAITRIKL